MIPEQPSTPWQHSFSLAPPSWRRSEVLDLVHVVDDVIGVLRRVKRVEGPARLGPPADTAYEAALCLQESLHAFIRQMGPPRSDPPG